MAMMIRHLSVPEIQGMVEGHERLFGPMESPHDPPWVFARIPLPVGPYWDPLSRWDPQADPQSMFCPPAHHGQVACVCRVTARREAGNDLLRRLLANPDFERVWSHAAAPPDLTGAVTDGVPRGLTPAEREHMEQIKANSTR
jgi:hypothetical protein